MKTPKAWLVQVWGVVILATGISSSGLDLYGQFQYGHPPSMGIVIGNASIVILGGLALTVAGCLRGLEDRLDRIERTTESVQSSVEGSVRS